MVESRVRQDEQSTKGMKSPQKKLNLAKPLCSLFQPRPNNIRGRANKRLTPRVEEKVINVSSLCFESNFSSQKDLNSPA